jgi:hypothetical protein
MLASALADPSLGISRGSVAVGHAHDGRTTSELVGGENFYAAFRHA